MALGELVNSDKENRFEFETLDVADIEYTDVILLALDLTTRAGCTPDVLRCETFIKRRSKALDVFLAVHEHRDRGKLPREPLNLGDPLSQPVRECTVR